MTKNKPDSIKVLHLEDLASDAEFVARVLKKSGQKFEVKVVDTRCEYEAALKNFVPEVILSDHSLPSFNSLEAMDVLQDSGLKIPFILVTGTVSDEFASEAMKKGAADYILKDRLQRLPSAIMSALDIHRMEKERRQQEQRVKETEKQYFDLIQHLPAAIYTCDVQGRVLIYNNAATELWGRSPGSEKGVWCGANALFDPAGNPMRPEDCPMARAVKTGKPIVEEVIIERPDGSRRHVLSHPTPNFDSSGQIVGATNMMIDITERKLQEMQTLTLVDSLQSRNRELGQFAYMVSHHLRAPIARILGLASIFDYNPTENKFIINKITEATHELDEVVRDINLVISARSPDKEKVERVRFEDKFCVITKVLAKEISESHAWITADFSEAPEVVTTKTYLYSILSNLLSNALKFRSQNRPLHVQFKTYRIENFICLSVRDNGMGMDLEKKAKDVFGMYKRFHGSSIPGKGVGLHLIKTQVEALGGRIDVESKPDEGCEFRVYLPDYYPHD